MYYDRALCTTTRRAWRQSSGAAPLAEDASPVTTSQIVRWRRGDPRLRPSRWRDAPRDCFDLLLDYQRCLRSLFLLFVAAEFFGALGQ